MHPTTDQTPSYRYGPALAHGEGEAAHGRQWQLQRNREPGHALERSIGDVDLDHPRYRGAEEHERQCLHDDGREHDGERLGDRLVGETQQAGPDDHGDRGRGEKTQEA
jgi:hypothetical protein